MKFTSVDAAPLRSRGAAPPPSWLTSARIASPMSVYARYRDQRSSWSADFGRVVVRVRTDAGVEGLSTGFGGAAAVAVIQEHLSRLLAGEDPRHADTLWEQMYRATLPYGRKGLAVMAISAVDEALWDAAGKAAGQPAYQLLGGACRESIPIYETTNDPQDWSELDGTGVKLALPYGPPDGKEGLTANARLVQECRRAVGPEREIMIDCYMALDVEYTRRLVDVAESAGVRWIEEPLPPDDYCGYESLSRLDSTVQIAAGEHEYTRWGFATLIDTGGVTILQPDVNWAGGISETRNIYRLASAYGLTVIPHAGALQAPALHLMMTQANTPVAEWVRTWDRAAGRPASLIEGVPDPAGGRIAASSAPGLGIRERREIA